MRGDIRRYRRGDNDRSMHLRLSFTNGSSSSSIVLSMNLGVIPPSSIDEDTDITPTDKAALALLRAVCGFSACQYVLMVCACSYGCIIYDFYWRQNLSSGPL